MSDNTVAARGRPSSSYVLPPSSPNPLLTLTPTRCCSLLAESIAPWRNLRLFFYFSASSSAFLGLLITLANISAPEGMRTTAPSEVDNLTANVGVNLLGVIGGAVAGYFDWKKGEELKSNVEAKRARVKSGRAADKKAQDKWDAVMSTPLALNSGEAKTLKELTSQKLSPVFLRGTRAYVGEQMLGAKLQKEVVKRSGMVVVPLPEGGEPRRGFGEDTMPEYAADGAEAREVVELMDGELRVAKEQVRGKPD